MSLALLAICCLTSLHGQSNSGMLRGAVTDPTHQPIPGAIITATSGGTQRTATAGDDGRFSISGLPYGSVNVVATAPGFVQRAALTASIGSAVATLDIQLELETTHQEVTVTEAAAPELSLDPAQTASSQVMRASDLESLADDPDDLVADLLALAGPAAGPAGGQIFIDGFTAGDGTLPSKDAIREVRINQNPFSPEFDTLGTGHIEILTKPGTDRLHGEGYFTYGDGLFNARNPYGDQKAPFALRDFGGSVSGSINKQASFFLNFDKRAINMGEVVNASTLDPRTLAIVSPYSTVAVSPLRRLYVGARIDYQINQNNTLMIRYEPNRNTSREAGIGSFTLPSEAYRSSLMEHSLQATETMLWGARTVNETRFQFRHQNSEQTPDSTDPSIVAISAFNGGGSLQGLHGYIHHHYEVQNYTTRTAAAHTWRFGVRLRAVSIFDTSEQNFNGTYVFGGAYAPTLNAENQPITAGLTCDISAPIPGCETITSLEQYRRTLLFRQMGMSPQQIRTLGGEPTQFSMAAGNPVVNAGGADIALFAGDDWKLRPNLTLSAGLRYEGQENIRNRDDFAPRVAFAWAPGRAQNPKTVFRGGFGIFYDRFSEQNVLLAQRYNGINQRQYAVIDPDFFPSIPPESSLGAATQQVVRRISSSMRASYLMQASMAVERQLPKKTTLALNYLNSHGLHEFRSRNINAPLFNGLLPYPSEGPIYEMESAGLYNQNSLVTTVNARPNARLSISGSYSFGYVRSNTDGLGTFPANQYNMAGEYGPAGNDVRHRFSLGGSITSIGGLNFSPLVIVQSGAPFNIITSQDVYSDTVLSARPGFATDPSLPGVIATSYGLFDPNPQPGELLVPRNYGRGPGVFTVNLRVGRTFIYRERYKLSLSVSSRNLLNHLNPGPIIGSINSPEFGRSNQLGGGFGAYSDGANNRRLEFQMRLGF